MAYKDILVHIDSGENCKDRVTAAIALAKRQEAHVTGIALALKSTISTYVGIDIPSSLTEAQQKIVQSSAKISIEEFETAAKDAGVKCSSKIIECSATKAPAKLAFHARHSDLSFITQPNPDEKDNAFQASLLEGLLFTSGRPVYVVPYIGRFDMKVRRAVLAWDGSTKATRAVNDAIPLLHGRSEVTVLIINPEKRKGAHGKTPGANIAAHLERHGINTKIEQHTDYDVTTDTLILNFLADNGADLLVMGAYSHSRIREKAFGGVTNSMLQQMTTPILMSQ